MQSASSIYKIPDSATNLTADASTTNNLRYQEKKLEPTFSEKAKKPLVRFTRYLGISLGCIIFSAFNDAKKGGLRFEESLANKLNECLAILKSSQKKPTELEWQPTSVYILHKNMPKTPEYEHTMLLVIENYSEVVIQQIRNFFAAGIIFNPFTRKDHPKDYFYSDEYVMSKLPKLRFYPQEQEDYSEFFKRIIHEYHIAKYKMDQQDNLCLPKKYNIKKCDLDEFVKAMQNNKSFITLDTWDINETRCLTSLIPVINIPFLINFSINGSIDSSNLCALLEQARLKQLNSLMLNGIDIENMKNGDVTRIVDLLLNLLTMPGNTLTTLELLAFIPFLDFHQTERIFSALCHSESALENLSISSSSKDPNSDDTDRLFLAFSNFLSKPTTKCKSLFLRLNKSGNTRIDRSPLLNALKHNSTLESLTLYILVSELVKNPEVCTFTERETISLIDLLDNHQQTNKSILTNLDLTNRYNAYYADGVFVPKSLEKQFFSGLRNNKFLSSLNVGFHDPHNLDTQQSFLRALEKNKALTSIRYPFTRRLESHTLPDKTNEDLIDKITKKLTKNLHRIELDREKWMPVFILIVAHRAHRNHFFASSIFSLIPIIIRLLKNNNPEKVSEAFYFSKKQQSPITTNEICVSFIRKENDRRVPFSLAY